MKTKANEARQLPSLRVGLKEAARAPGQQNGIYCGRGNKCVCEERKRAYKRDRGQSKMMKGKLGLLCMFCNLIPGCVKKKKRSIHKKIRGFEERSRFLLTLCVIIIQLDGFISRQTYQQLTSDGSLCCFSNFNQSKLAEVSPKIQPH